MKKCILCRFDIFLNLYAFILYTSTILMLRANNHSRLVSCMRIVPRGAHGRQNTELIRMNANQKVFELQRTLTNIRGSQNNFFLHLKISTCRFSPKFSILIGLENLQVEIVKWRKSSSGDEKKHAPLEDFLHLTISTCRFCKLAIIITKKHKST